jgi:hypothetical protein
MLRAAAPASAFRREVAPQYMQCSYTTVQTLLPLAADSIAVTLVPGVPKLNDSVPADTSASSKLSSAELSSAHP